MIAIIQPKLIVTLGWGYRVCEVNFTAPNPSLIHRNGSSQPIKDVFERMESGIKCSPSSTVFRGGLDRRSIPGS